MGRRDRRRCAAQLLALGALLAEFELWAPTWTIRNARVVESGGALQAVLGGFPVGLSRVYGKLGGGERAARILRDETVNAVGERFRVDLRRSVDDIGAQGLFLDQVLEDVLARLARPLDHVTASNLWASRWTLPVFPGDGEITYTAVPDRVLSLRLGAALKSALHLRGRSAWVREVAGGDVDTAPFPALGAQGTLILVGLLSEDEIIAVERWVRLEGCSAAAIGVFPRGWVPVEPVAGSACPGPRIALAGGARADRRFANRRDLKFVLTAAESEDLTEAARTLFKTRDNGVPRATLGDAAGRVLDLLCLLPEGLPEGFLICHGELKKDDLQQICEQVPMITEDGRWRLARRRPMVRNSLHQEVASLFPEGDPRRLRHLVLAGGDPAELGAWTRNRLDDLDGAAVRALFSDIGPGELGEAAQEMLVEAYLSDLDLAGARDALAGLSEDLQGPWSAWINTVDRPEQWLFDCATFSDVERIPRAAAECAAAVLRKARSSGTGEDSEAAKVLQMSVERMRGLLGSWCEIEMASVVQPRALADRVWRRKTVGGNETLSRLVQHKRALQLRNEGQSRAARRLLGRLADKERSPGRLALICFDLGGLDLETGRRRSGIWWLLKAHRLFETAGFQHRTRNVLFNLAVEDIDQLELARAEKRLEAAASTPDDLFVILERARLALAQGDDEAFATYLGKTPDLRAVTDPRVLEAVHLLRGISALLCGDLGQARSELKEGGDEGRGWLAIVTVLQGGTPPLDTADDWGLDFAGRLIHYFGNRDHRGPQPGLPTLDDLGAGQALGLALTARLLGHQRFAPPRLLAGAARLLDRNEMSGWARWLRASAGIGDAFVDGMAQLAEGQVLGALRAEQVTDILDEVGITGLEVRSTNQDEVIWRIGDGKKHGEHRRGRLTLIPLGGEPAAGPGWRLLAALLELVTPPTTQAELDPAVARTGILGTSAGARQLRVELQRYAPTNATILLLGETGVGKEVAARALHDLSGRSGQLIPVNVAGIPEALLESHLFGTVRGAFTGADRALKGLVEAAEHGTLFLDEIGDLGMPMQVKLLRFLESHEVRAVGSDRSRVIDVRVVTATHRDLQAGIKAGTFREDLYYRLSVAPVCIPPLRERREDIVLLRDHFEREFTAENGLPLCRWTAEAEKLLERHEWPGNVRELKNAVERGILRCSGGVVAAEDLAIGPARTIMPSGSYEEAQADFRREFLLQALARNRGNRSATARDIGISRQGLLYQIRVLGL